MKFGELTSIGHNLADSLGCGNGFLIGLYQTDIFGEAANSNEKYITVDFLSGTTSGAKPSPSLAKAISLYSEALDEFCRRHGTSSRAFSELRVRFLANTHEKRFIVTVRDTKGNQSTDEYLGSPGRRVMELDQLGRLRPKRTKRFHSSRVRPTPKTQPSFSPRGRQRQ